MRFWMLTQKPKIQWQELFDIKPEDEVKGVLNDPVLAQFRPYKWNKRRSSGFVLINRIENKEYGRYYDIHYARNRAKFFYKRIMRSVEKTLLGGRKSTEAPLRTE